MQSPIIYFDNNATTKVSKQVLEKMNEVYNFPLNSSATHQFGRMGNAIIEEARKNLTNLLNAKSYEVIFNSGATEASNTLIFGSDVEIILISKIEHAAVFNCRPSDKKIIEIETLENGTIDLADFQKKLAEISTSNFLVSVMLANNETGAIQPIEEITKLTHQKGGLMHSDIVQAVGKIEIDLEKLNVDFASVSAHKLHGPQGVGALLMRKGLGIKPLIIGGKQEKSRRAGTTNVAGIAGFGEACKTAKEKISDYKKTKDLRDFLESEIKKIAGNNIEIFAEKAERLPNTSQSAIRNSDSQTQLINFDLNGICVSAGSACSSGTIVESRILKSMNVDPSFSSSAIRVSLSPENTRDEVEKFIKIWVDFYQKNCC